MIRFTLAFLIGLSAASASSQSNTPIPMEGRTVPFRIDGAAATRATKRELVTSFDLGTTEAKADYAVFVPQIQNAQFVVNGKEVPINPLPRTDGSVTRIPSYFLSSGTNTLEIKPADTEPAGNWTDTVMFSLDGTFEEVHFAAAFSDVSPKAPPATSSDENKYDVLSYDCSFTPRIPTASSDTPQILSGVVIMKAKALQNLNTVVMDFHRHGGVFNITAVDQGVATGALSFSQGTPLAGEVSITLPSSVLAGQEFTVRLMFSGSTPDGSPTFRYGRAFTHAFHNGTPVLYSFSEPYAARGWWPCKDLPSDKATVVIRVTVPSLYQVVSNGKLDPLIDNGNGTKTWIWRHNKPVATYLVSVCISNYQYSEATYTGLNGTTQMPIRHAIYPENNTPSIEGNAAAGTLQVMNFIRTKFGEYPFIEDKYYTATHGSGAGMEHQTCTSMPPGATEGVGDGYTRRNIHELAHQWYGDRVTCTTFDHLWLQEGMATYVEALWDEDMSGISAYHTNMRSHLSSIYTGETTPLVGINSDAFSQATVYNRGAWIYHMVRHVVGDTAFYQGCRAYLEDPATSYGNGVSADLERVMEAASGMNLDAFFQQWMYWYKNSSTNPTSSMMPTYTFTGAQRTVSANSNFVDVTITQTQPGPAFTMPLDVRITDSQAAVQTKVVNNNQKSQVLSVDVGAAFPVEIELDPDQWVLRRLGLSIKTVGLSVATRSQSYSRTMKAANGSSYSWTATGLPPGVTMSTAGVLSGTPTAAGSYLITVNVTSGSSSASTVLPLLVQEPVMYAVKINEVDYDENLDVDSAEFVELYNSGSTPVDLSGWKLELWNGGATSATPYATVTIPNGTTLARASFYLVGPSSMGAVDATFPATTDQIQNGAPDCIRLIDSTGGVQDAFAYELGGSTAYAGPANGMEGTGFRGGDAAATPAGGQTGSTGISVGRYPDGADTGDNQNDFHIMPPTRKTANGTALALPFSTNFSTLPSNPGIFTPFVNEEITALPAGSVPASNDTASPNSCLKIADKSFGGDEMYFGGAGNVGALRVRGQWYLKSSVTGGMTWEASGMLLKNTKCPGFFGTSRSASSAFGFEKGVSVLYYAGAASLQGVVQNAAGKVIVTQHNPAPTESDATLAQVAVAGNRWVSFDIQLDYNSNLLRVNVNGTDIYSGTVPSGMPQAGGVALGYRQSGGTFSGDNGGFFDALTIDANAAGVEDYQLY